MPIFALAAAIRTPIVAGASGIDVVRLDIWDVANKIGSAPTSGSARSVEWETVKRLRGVRSVWQSPFATVSLVERTGAVDFVAEDSWGLRWHSGHEGFALGAATFSRDSVLCSVAVDADGDPPTPVICRSFDGAERWRFLASPGHSVPKLAWDDERLEWLILEFDFDRRERDELVRLTDDGEVVVRWDAGATRDQVFAAGERLLVTSGGSIVDTRSGALSGSLPVDE